MKDQMDIEKFDMDSTLSYALNGTFKVFGGVKYQGYKYEDNYYVTMPGIGIVENGQITMDMKSTGPGLGLGVTYPVISSLFLVVQISGIYMYSSFHSNTFGEHKYDIWGWNSSMGLAWFQQSMNTTFSLGGRYQNLKYSKRYSGSFDQNNPTDKDPVAGERDIFYGLTLSATYTFSI